MHCAKLDGEEAERFERWWSNLSSDVATEAVKEIAQSAWVAGRSNKSFCKQTTYSVHLMYRIAWERGPRFEELKRVEAENKTVAMEIARQNATRRIEDEFKGNEIESWDVKIRPVQVG